MCAGVVVPSTSTIDPKKPFYHSFPTKFNSPFSAETLYNELLFSVEPSSRRHINVFADRFLLK